LEIKALALKTTLKLYASTTWGYGDRIFAVFNASDDWEELEITWNNQPAIGVEQDRITNPTAGSWVEFDVTGIAKQEFAGDKMVTLIIESIEDDGDYLSTYSKEHWDAGLRPYLEIS